MLGSEALETSRARCYIYHRAWSVLGLRVLTPPLSRAPVGAGEFCSIG
jgi:hypothetical protein